jgi:hypothetical protein
VGFDITNDVFDRMLRNKFPQWKKKQIEEGKFNLMKHLGGTL